MDIGKRIRKARKEQGYSQEKLAEHFNISVQAVSKWECEQSYPDISLLPKIADFLRIPLDYLLRDDIEENHLIEKSTADNVDKIRFEFGLGLLPYIIPNGKSGLMQKIKELHQVKEFPKIRICDNAELDDLQYRIIVNGIMEADNSVKYVGEDKRMDEMLSFIKFAIM